MQGILKYAVATSRHTNAVIVPRDAGTEHRARPGIVADEHVVVDKRLLKEGYDPRSEDYWDEFTSRLKKTLPHRYNGDGNESNETVTTRERPRSMNVSTERGGATNGSAVKNTFMLNAQRVAALKEAGMWDDPVKRNKMIKAYAEADRKAGR